jgi:uncharacterized RDD family membrane protein YckC
VNISILIIKPNIFIIPFRSKDMFCPGCGAENPDDAKYCQNCAKQLNGVREEFERENSPEVLPSVTNIKQTLDHVGFWPRFGAFFIDIIIIYILQFIIGFFLGFILILAYEPIYFDEIIESTGFSALSLIILVIIFLLYFCILESSKNQASFGKQFAKIIVVDISGQRLTTTKSLLRAVGKIISLVIFGLGFIMIAFSDQKHGLHDVIAGTDVINASDSGHHS